MRRPNPTADERGLETSFFEIVYDVVRRIPRGKVATYGQVAQLAGKSRMARHVGFALAATGDAENLPWHRVVNSKGRVSPRRLSGYHELQESLLRAEGVRFDDGCIDLEAFAWRSPKIDDRDG